MMNLLKHCIGNFANKFFFSFSYLLNKVAGRRPVLLTGWVSVSRGKISKHNLGDDLNYFLLKELTERPLFFTETMFSIFKYMKHYCCIGSIIENFANSHSVIWGSGAIAGKKEITPPLKILSVRGPLSREWLMKQGIDCPECYGDPVLLLPLVYNKAVEKKYTYGIIPHFFDSSLPQINEFQTQVSDVLVIDLQKYNDWHDVVDNIRSCKYILSSSLHGLIIADTYNIPNVWIELSHNVEGNGFKFQDYFMSVGRKVIGAQDCTKTICIDSINKQLQEYMPISFDRDEYKKRMPF